MPFFRLQFFRFLGAPVLIALLGLIPSQAAAETLQLQPYSNNPILAIVDGEPVILDDLKNAEIHEAMVQLYQMQTQVLKEKILEKLSVKHPKLKPDGAPLPTQDDIVQFYKDTPGVRALGTIEKMQGEIRAYLEKVFQSAYIEERYQLALKKGWAKVYLQPPLEFTLEAAVGTAKLWFEKDDEVSRRVFLLEYS
ncbi:MAG: hypothetical protein IID18_08355, partial [Nitrospinae bacterium]|nr:hypothetical protein [Nitrospinota bacterium]